MIFVFYIFIFFFPSAPDNEANLIKSALLTGEDKKEWYLAAKTPEDIIESCKATSELSLDNTWTFFADGTFEFNHGEITETDCQEEGCCTDFVNLIGKWELNDGETTLKVTLLHEKGNLDNSISDVLIDAKIEGLTEEKLLISQTDSGTGAEFIYEFRKR